MSEVYDDEEETSGSITEVEGTKVYTNTTLDCTFPVKVPSTADEFDQMAGRKGACVEEAIRNIIYRSVNHEFRAKLCAKLEEHTGIPRETKTTGEGDSAKTEYTETEKKYKARLILSGAVDQERCQIFANEIAKEIKFDPSPSKRRGGPTKEIQIAAESILNAIEMGQSSGDIVSAKIAAKLGISDFVASFGEFNEASLIQALVAIDEKEKREKVSGLL